MPEALSPASAKLVEQHLPLVHFVVQRLHHRDNSLVDYEDLVNDGVFGLAFAVQNYDPSKGYTFSTYASKCIRGFILNAVNDLIKEQARAKRRGAAIQTFTLDTEARGGEALSDQGQSVEELEEATEQRWRWHQVQATLSPFQLQIFELLRQGHSQSEAARRLGVSPQTVHNHYHRSLGLIRRRCLRIEAEAARRE